MLTHEEILEIYETGSEAVIAVIQKLETILKEPVSRIPELEGRAKVLEAT